MTVKDFKTGQKVWVQLTGNAARDKTEEQLIEEWEIISVGRKYIKARKNGWLSEITFEIREYGYSGNPVQKTDGCVSYIMHNSKEEILEEFEKAKLFSDVDRYFRNFGSQRDVTLDQIRKIHKILFAKSEQIESEELKMEIKIEEHDKEIRNKAIEEFKNTLLRQKVIDRSVVRRIAEQQSR